MKTGAGRGIRTLIHTNILLATVGQISHSFYAIIIIGAIRKFVKLLTEFCISVSFRLSLILLNYLLALMFACAG